MAKSKVDKWSQIGYILLQESAANALTFNGISVFSNILTPKGLIIHEIQYDITVAAMALLVASADALTFGLAGDNAITTISMDNAQVYDYNAISRLDLGTAGSGIWHKSPVSVDYSNLPGGGMLVPADRVYGFVQGVSLASAALIALRFRFTLAELTAQEYIELAQALRVLT